MTPIAPLALLDTLLDKFVNYYFTLEIKGHCS